MIHLKSPYKILSNKVKRYSEHYKIPHACLIVPISEFGDDVSCDVRWEDNDGVFQMKEGIFFTKKNIEPINPMVNYKLEELWALYYGNSQRRIGDNL
jgi:hypothetical protein